MVAISIMMDRIKTYAPHKDKNGWHLQKVHDMLHTARDIENYGSPNNVDAASNENILLSLPRNQDSGLTRKRKCLYLK